MDNAQLVAEMRRLLSTEAPQVTVADPEQLLAFAGQMSAQFKVRLLLAMGFTPQRPAHQASCVSLQGSGFICTCVWPPTVWIQPEDVDVLRGETPEERKAATEARNAHEDDEDPEDAVNLIDAAPIL